MVAVSLPNGSHPKVLVSEFLWLLLQQYRPVEQEDPSLVETRVSGMFSGFWAGPIGFLTFVLLRYIF